MRISDWSSDVCSSDLLCPGGALLGGELPDLHAVVENLLAARDVEVERQLVPLRGLLIDNRRELLAHVVRQRLPELHRGHQQIVDELGRESGRERVCPYV